MIRVVFRQRGPDEDDKLFPTISWISILFIYLFYLFVLFLPGYLYDCLMQSGHTVCRNVLKASHVLLILHTFVF